MHGRSANFRQRIGTGIVLALAAAAAPAAAQDLTYQPVNPSFGGNPFSARASSMNACRISRSSRSPTTR